MDKMVKTKWKVGDKCFYNADEGEILEIEDGWMTVGDANGRRSGDLSANCFPITERSSYISEQFCIAEENFRSDLGDGSFNFPRFCDVLSDKWTEAMEDPDRDVELLGEYICWTKKVVDKAFEHKKESIDGVKLYRFSR
jgi:hypothetical protein